MTIQNPLNQLDASKRNQKPPSYYHPNPSTTLLVKKTKKNIHEQNNISWQFHSFSLVIATLSSNRFIDLIKPGITTNSLAHIGGLTHLTNSHLEQFKNFLPGLRSVHEVTFVVSIPHLQIAIFNTCRRFLQLDVQQSES